MNELAVEEKLLTLDKSSWESVKLGDLARDISERVDSPAQSEYTRFVGLEHFISGELKIKSWGSTENLTSSTKAFKAGDILFARRNAYLRRASLVEFDGVCSGDAFVLREKRDRVAPGFLAFLLNSNALWEYANSNAAGTMSKRVKWRDLADYEFLLPPKDLQSQIAELLWALDEVVEKLYTLDLSNSKFFKANQKKLMLEGINKKLKYSTKLKQEVAEHWQVHSIGDLQKKTFITQIQDGNHGEKHPKSSQYVEEGIPFIMANSLEDGKILFESCKKLPQSITDNLRIGFSKPGDILLSHKGTVGETAIVPDQIKWPYLMLTPQVTYYRVNPNKLDNKFLFYLFNSSYFQSQLIAGSSQSTRAYVGITAQKKLKVAIPNDLEEQKEIVRKVDSLEQTFDAINKSTLKTKELQKSLINQIFKK